VPVKNRKSQSAILTAVVANARGEIFDLSGYGAVGGDGPLHQPLTTDMTRILPYGTELMYLPDRVPLLYNLRTRQTAYVDRNPFAPEEAIFPVAAFNSPGYVITHTSAYKENPSAGYLPLFSYGAVGWQRGQFRSAVIRVDREPRQDLRHMPLEKIKAGVNRLRRALPDNRLRVHLENCALVYGCPAGKNFFLGRYEAPLPTSTACNARCLGCISLQPDRGIPSSQNRIGFTPGPEEISQVALTHIRNVECAVVSFGQGCEGDPLMAADTIVRAIGLIRRQTAAGTINMNTNGSLPEKIKSLLDAGLDSLRISMNSVREICYNAYFRPTGYRFEDVLASIDLALNRNIHVAVNYLNCPGFTDSPEEGEALIRFIRNHPIHMIQWRNLNFDPLRYLGAMNRVVKPGRPMGMRRLLQKVQTSFPGLTFGYFNPPKEKFTPTKPDS
jgi:pyruvate-formate lyase-activating enzyme